MSEIRILDIGCGTHRTADGTFASIEDKEIVHLDIDPSVNPDVVHDITQPLPEELVGQFDLVLASHVFEHIDRAKVIDAFKNVTSAVKNRGEIWILVPSLEWILDQIQNRREGMHIQMALFGAQDGPYDYHRCAFTMRALRQMVEVQGLIVKKAFQSTFTIIIGDKSYPAVQNVIYAAKYEGLGDPVEAVSETA